MKPDAFHQANFLAQVNPAGDSLHQPPSSTRSPFFDSATYRLLAIAPAPNVNEYEVGPTLNPWKPALSPPVLIKAAPEAFQNRDGACVHHATFPVASALSHLQVVLAFVWIAKPTGR